MRWGRKATILVHSEDLETLLMTSKCALFYSHNLSFLLLLLRGFIERRIAQRPQCPFLPQQNSQNCCIFRVAKNYCTSFRRPLCWHPGTYAPCPHTPPLSFISELKLKSKLKGGGSQSLLDDASSDCARRDCLQSNAVIDWYSRTLQLSHPAVRSAGIWN